ncbi:LPXTG cell wall anchor domain-containing protein [Paenibacillus psychroresistens]|uniref:LPXTG cell wall anchor domain-containing protein n=1 Tax=Paenibacillus psychroresistens TaxID=1778678 RepID=A0A6B8RWK0_9BACL|nr:collagen binding domain-containing protein [Paenibacillus psychroresistens]QGQ99566.1 LPXTG cell wall anchor domain-containing protein [Paenibacillus psychroresistens]
MLKRKISMMIIALVLIMQSVNGMGFIKQANAIATTIESHLNILTGVTMVVYESPNVPVTGNVYSQGSDVTLNYTWALPNNHGYEAGSTFEFALPVEFALYNDITNSSLLFNGTPIGSFSVDKASKKVLMTFNDFIEGHDDVQGTLTFTSKFDMTQITDSTTHVIQFPVFQQLPDVTVHFKPNVGLTIEKKGVPHSFNPDQIDWTIDINKALGTVQNAVVTDQTPAGLGNPSGITIQQLDVSLNGTTSIPVVPVILNPNNYTVTTSAGGLLTITFHDSAATITSAYRISYVTSILDTATSYTNTASFSGSNLPSVVSSATVAVVRGVHLGKRSPGYNSTTQTIDWEIKYNYDGKVIPAGTATLTDLFNDSQDYLPVSAVVYKISLSPTGTETIVGSPLVLNTDYTLTPVTSNGTTQGFTLTFKENTSVIYDASSAYKILYKTISHDRVESNTTIHNTVTSDVYTATGNRGINQIVIAKSNDNVNYQNKTLDWHLTINQDNYTMKHVVVTDTFTSGDLEFIPGSLVVKRNGVDVASSVYTVASLVLHAGFTVDFHNHDITGIYTISYKTYFDKRGLTSTISNYVNKGKIEWQDDSNSPTQHQAEATSTFTPRIETRNNGSKSGSYNAITKEITWTVGLNYNSRTINHAILADTLLEGQELVPNSLKVSAMNIGLDGTQTLGSALANTMYGLILNNVTNTVYVNFNGPINSPYYVEFKTSLAGKLIDAQIPNTAQLFDTLNLASGNLTASVPVVYGGEYVAKDGHQNNNIIDWTVHINRGQSTVNDAIILDEPSVNQLLLQDSFHLFATTVNMVGALTKDRELVKDTDYTVVIHTDNNSKQTFVLSFIQPITKAYILEYKSVIFADSHDTVSNKVTLSGNNVTTVSVPTIKNIEVLFSSGSGTGSGVIGKLTVTKVDQDSPSLNLSGATFALYRDLGSSEILVNTLTTGLDGKLVFNNLLGGNYILKETVAPAGYLLDSSAHNVTINSITEINQVVTNTKITTSTPTPTPTPSPIPGSATQSPTPAPTEVPTATPTVTPTVTPVVTPTATPVVTPVVTPAVTPSATPVVKPTATPPGKIETTKQDVPITGTVKVPEGSTPSIGKGPEHGTVTVGSDGKWIYTPKPGFTGSDSFSIIITDKDGNEEEVFINIDVEEVPLGVSPGDGMLPTTGESSHMNVILAGLFLIILGFALRSRFLKRR